MIEIPPHIKPFVDVLGDNKAIEFLLRFGGTPVYLATNPQARSLVVDCVGYDLAVRLGRKLGPGAIKIPTAKPWIAKHLSAKGWTGIAISRKLHTDDRTVRGWLNGRNKRQLDLFKSEA